MVSHLSKTVTEHKLRTLYLLLENNMLFLVSAFSAKSIGQDFQQSLVIFGVTGVGGGVKASLPVLDGRSNGWFDLSQSRFCFLILIILALLCHV